MAETNLTFQDILDQRRSTSFVGRQTELDFFRKNLSLPPNDLERKFIIHVRGQGGIGKTTLLKRYQAMATEKGLLTGMVDEWQDDVPEVLGVFAKQFEDSDHKLEDFTKRYHDYRAKKGEVEADPNAPQGFAGFLGRSIAVSGVKLLRRAPAVGAAAEFIDEEAMGEQASEFASYLARKFKNKDDVELVSNPIEVLTPIFVAGLKEIVEDRPIALFFDTFEKSGSYLDQWLRNLLEGRFSILPANVLFVVAGRDPLDQNWTAFEPLIHRIDLTPLSEPDAESYLLSQGLTNEETIQVIIKLSGCIPLLLATLASQSPDNPVDVGDPSGDAVDRFLKWVEDPKQREAALYGALPIILNQNIFEVVMSGENAGSLFTWLKRMPFVKQVKDGWVYHEVVRGQMLRFARKENPQNWRELHQKLQVFFLKDNVSTDSKTEGREPESISVSEKGFGLYHQLCAAQENAVTDALNLFLDTLKVKRADAKTIAEMIQQAGTDVGSEKIKNWGSRLLLGLNAYENKDYPVLVDLFSDLLEFKSLGRDRAAISYAWHGEVYRLMRNYKAALKDFDNAIALDENYKWAIANRGVTYRLIGNYEAALKDLNRAIGLDEKYKWAIANRGETYRMMKNFEAAFNDLNRVIDLDDKYSFPIASRGATYRMVGNYEASLKDLSLAIDVDQKYKWAIANRGETYRLMKNYEAALKDFNRAIELDEKYQWVIANRGVTYRLMGNYDAALKDLSCAIELDEKYKWAIANRGEAHRMMKNYEAAFNDLDRAIALDDKYSFPLASRGATYRMVKNYQASLNDLNLAIELDDKNQWAIANRGETYRLMKNYEAALKDFNHAIELDEKYQWVIGSRGLTYRAIKNYEAALKDFNRAIELDDKADWVIAGRGETYRLMANYEAALIDLNRAIELNDKDEVAIARRGATYRLMNNYDAAVKDLSVAIELDGAYKWAIAQRGETHRLMKKYEAALDDLNRAIQLDEKYQWAIGRRGITYLEMKDYNNALKDFDRAIELDDKEAWALAGRGVTNLLLGKNEPAIADLSSVLSFDQDNALNYCLLSIAQKKIGNEVESSKNIEKAIDLGKSKREKNAGNLSDAFDLATYYLIAGQTETAISLYEETISLSPSEETLKDAIDNLELGLSLLPKDKGFENALTLLRESLKERMKN